MLNSFLTNDDDDSDDIGCLQISKAIQMLVRWHRDGPEHPAFKLHQFRVRDYLWSVVLFFFHLLFVFFQVSLALTLICLGRIVL